MPDQVMTAAEFDPAVADLPTIGRAGVVPYVALWSGELVAPARVVELPGGGVGYADQAPGDREWGVVWERMACRPGVGRPDFRSLHPLRQRHVMRDLLCQVCARPAADGDRSALWLMSSAHRAEPGWPRRVDMALPAVCARCAVGSVRRCPWLRHDYVAVRARSYISGVFAARYRPSRHGPVVAGDLCMVPFDDPRIGWAVATQLVRTLRDCVEVGLDIDS